MKSSAGALPEIAAGIALSAYRLGGTLVGPFLPYVVAGRSPRGRRNTDRVAERRGYPSHARPPGSVIWVHAVSVGETNAVLPLVERLATAGHAVVFTSTTATSAEIAAARLPTGAVHQFVPYDVPACVARFLAHWRPRLAIVVESEVWPTIIAELSTAAVPLVVVNGRMSERSYRAWRRVRWVAGRVFGGIALCLAQSDSDCRQFAALGAPRVEVTGNLKFDTSPPSADAGEVERLRAAIAGRPVWLAASTHDPEEAIVADAHKLLSESHPGLLTIVVPRHPARGEAIGGLFAAAGLSVARRSAGTEPAPTIDVYVADTLGELGLFYRTAPIAFIGNSLASGGGHNPIEPVRLNAAVVHGPNVDNFAEVYRRLDDATGHTPVVDAPTLAAAVAAFFDDPAAVAATTARALAALAPLTGAVDRTMDALGPWLADGGGPT